MPTTSPFTAATPPSAGGPAPQRSAELGRDEFLQLFVAQLRDQDPTSPQDGHEFVAQLAQFSSVEQLSNLSGSLAQQSSQLSA